MLIAMFAGVLVLLWRLNPLILLAVVLAHLLWVTLELVPAPYGDPEVEFDCPGPPSAAAC